MEHSFSEAGAFKLARLTRLKRNFRHKKDLFGQRSFFIRWKIAPSSDIRLQIPFKERFTCSNNLVKLCTAHC